MRSAPVSPDRLSERAYLALLSLYPAQHRLTYGPLMLQAFRDLERSSSHERGRWGSIALWARVLPDLGASAAYEQFQDWRDLAMSLTCKTNVDPHLTIGFIFAAIVLAVGVAGKVLFIYFGGPVVGGALVFILLNLVSAALVARITREGATVVLAMALWMALAFLPMLWVPDPTMWLRRNPFNVGIIVLIAAYALRATDYRSTLYAVAAILGVAQVGAAL